MCGRVALFTPPVRLARLLDAALAAGFDPDVVPSWNLGPQRTLFAVAERHEERLMDSYQWGLIPSWSKDPKIGNRLFNARGETIIEKPSFRTAFAKRPCVIPVDGFYEWDHRDGHQKQPHFFTRADGQIVQCEIMDISTGGVSLRTDIRPELGEFVLIAQLAGRVTRHHDQGIDIEFVGQQPGAEASPKLNIVR